MLNWLRLKRKQNILRIRTVNLKLLLFKPFSCMQQCCYNFMSFYNSYYIFVLLCTACTCKTVTVLLILIIILLLLLPLLLLLSVSFNLYYDVLSIERNDKIRHNFSFPKLLPNRVVHWVTAFTTNLLVMSSNPAVVFTFYLSKFS